MSEPEQYRLTALPGRPNRVLPIGSITEGKRAGAPCSVHVHTGSTRIVAAADVPALREHLAQQGITGDYTLVPVQRTARGSGHKRGRFAPPRSRSRTPAAVALNSSNDPVGITPSVAPHPVTTRDLGPYLAELRRAGDAGEVARLLHERALWEANVGADGRDEALSLIASLLKAAQGELSTLEGS